MLPLAARADVSTAELQEAYRWFDTLGYPDIGKLPFVQVADGMEPGPFGAQNSHHTIGFLIEDAGKKFTVLTSDLRTIFLEKTDRGVVDTKRVSYDRLDLLEWSRKRINAPDFSPPTDGGEGLMLNFIGGCSGIGTNGQMFVLSRAVDARGQASLAYRLFNSSERGTYADSLQKRMRYDLAYGCAQRALWDFGDLTVSRTALLAEYQEITTRFPESKEEEEAREAVRILTDMVREDGEHARIAAKPIESLAVQDQVKELIFQLRDQNGHQWSNPGSCDIFTDERREKSPAGRLVKMGVQAAPQLIGALSDMRFTRSSPILRIADAARAILERIAHRSFDVRDNTWADMTNSEHAANVITAVRKWWNVYSIRGEKAALTEGVSSGDDDAGEQAELLVAQYPEAAFHAIERGLQHASDPFTSTRLLDAAATLANGDLTSLYYDQLTHNASLLVRVDAAAHLYERSDPRALPAMIDEWRKFTGDIRRQDWPIDGHDELASFLADCGDTRAIDALAANLQGHPPGVKLLVIAKLVANGEKTSITGKHRVFRPDATIDTNKQVAGAIERLLALELRDTSESHDMPLGLWAFDPSRICDVAAYALSTRWPLRYHYKHTTSLFERDSQRFDSYNTWANANRMAGVENPARPTVPPVAAEVIGPMLHRLVTASKQDEREAAAAAIGRMGLPALPSVLQTIRTETPAEPALVRLKSVANHLACIVRETHGNDALLQVYPGVKGDLTQMRGEPLTPAAYIHLITDAARAVRDGDTRLVLRAYRDNDGSGFQITLEVTSDSADKPPTPDLWRVRCWVFSGTEQLYNCGAGGYVRKELPEFVEQVSSELTNAISKVLASQPLETISIDVELTRKE